MLGSRGSDADLLPWVRDWRIGASFNSAQPMLELKESNLPVADTKP